MALNYNKFKFIIAILVILGIGVACSSKKDSTKEDTKKEKETAIQKEVKNI